MPFRRGCCTVKLKHLARWNAERRDRAAEYDRLLAGNEGVKCPFEPSWSKAVYHLYVIRVADRDGLMSHLNAAGIGSGMHYPVPLHLQKAYARMNYSAGDFPVTTAVASSIVSLPMYPQLTAAQQARVAAEVLEFTARSARPVEAAKGRAVLAEVVR